MEARVPCRKRILQPENQINWMRIVLVDLGPRETFPLFSKCFRKRFFMLRSIPTLGVFLVSMTAVLAVPIDLPSNLKVASKAVIGEGTGELTAADGKIIIQGTAKSPGKYVENWYIDATVFDFVLPNPVPLTPGVERIGFEYHLPEVEKGKRETLSLRALIQDARGALWSLGTRIGARRSQLNYVFGMTTAESFAFDTNEIGRRDPWAVMPVDGKQLDDYDEPKPPFSFAGFRVYVTKPTTAPFVIEMESLAGLKAEAPSPYWNLQPQRSWTYKNSTPLLPSRQVFGWGDAKPQPIVRAANINLKPGKYSITWEILNAQTEDRIASDVSDVTVEELNSVIARLPLLPVGTYQVRIGARAEGAKERRDAFYTYVVIGNKSGKKSELPDAKPLKFTKPSPDKLKLTSDDAAGEIRWMLQTTDQRVLKEGKAPAGAPLDIDLAAWRGKESVVWLNARLVNKAGEEVDSIFRTIGLQSIAAPAPKPDAESTKSKFETSLGNKVFRTKGDWSEGSYPVASQSQQTLKDLEPWLDEAKSIGYNSVELSAPWYDLNSAPGVYQFEYLDKLVEAARARGLYVTFRIHPIANTFPDWLELDFMTDQNGYAHGVWGDGESLIASAASKPLRKGFFEFVSALASHYKNDPYVLGYTVESLFFDHDLVDAPWLGVFVDYSQAAHSGFHAFLEKRYADSIGKLNEAYGTSYANWSEIALPRPELSMNADGLLKPRTEPVWKDWMDFKIGEIRDLRMGAMDILRKEDPRCWIGMYISESSAFYIEEAAKKGFWLTYGSMESPFPVENIGIRGRYEPHNKIAKSAILVDVGMTNVFMIAPPGYHAIFNYWMVDKQLSEMDGAVVAAENRLKTWFSVADQLVGAEPYRAPAFGATLISNAGQLSLLQHAFTGRTEDFLRPWHFRLGADDVTVQDIEWDKANPPDLKKFSYLYLPYSTNVVEKETIDAVREYVESGHRLIVEANSGFWLEENENALFAALGLPQTVPTASKGEVSQEKVKWESGAPMSDAPLGFRTREFRPPIDEQASRWIHNIPRAFLRPYRISGDLPENAKVLARYADGKPAAAIIPRGKGEILLFAGVVDWIDSPGLARAVDAWAGGGKKAPESKGDLELISQTMRKDDNYYVVGRRYIDHVEMIPYKSASDALPEGEKSALNVKWTFEKTPSGKFYVRELVTGLDLGEHSASELAGKGLTLNLSLGEGFILEARPKQ